MNPASKILTNGYMPLIPIFVWNSIFISKLPLAYQPQSFNHDIPMFIIFGENLFRIIIFILPLFFKLSIREAIQKKGLVVFVTGVALYFLSWLILIYMPDSKWGSNLIGFTAPAFTPIIWLLGLSLMVDKYYVFTYSRWHYIIPSIIFSIFHIYHAVYVFNRANV